MYTDSLGGEYVLFGSSIKFEVQNNPLLVTMHKIESLLEKITTFVEEPDDNPIFFHYKRFHTNFLGIQL